MQPSSDSPVSTPLAAPAALIYQQFVLALVAQQQVMALINSQQQWAWSGTGTQQALALWQHPSFIKPVIGYWPNYRVFPISLEELIYKIIPVLAREQKYLSLNLAADGQHVVVQPKQLLTDLKNYLYELERLQPQQFRTAGLPKARKIRLHD